MHISEVRLYSSSMLKQKRSYKSSIGCRFGIPAGSWNFSMELSLKTTSLFMMWEPHNLWVSDKSTLYFSPGHPSWMCTAQGRTHRYCLKFRARADRSPHVWGMSKVGECTVRWCSTESSQNYCAGFWWAKHNIVHLLAVLVLLLIYQIRPIKLIYR